MTKPSSNRWDVFISHASEDKEPIVEPLANALSAFGVRVWYDEFTLKLGDSLSRSIDGGLAQSDFGLAVLSPAFFAKQWPEYELRGLTAKEVSGRGAILPIWHQVTKEEVLAFSPPLADKLAVSSKDLSPVALAVAVIEVIRPDILTNIHRRVLYYRSLAEGRKAGPRRVDPKKLDFAPVRHEELPDELIGRIRLVRAALLGVYTHSMEFWLEGFQRDAHPSKEVSSWEHAAAVLLEYRALTRLTKEQYDSAWRIISGLTLARSGPEEVNDEAKSLPDDAIKKLTNLARYNLPIYDIEETAKFERQECSKEVLEFYAAADKELFPQDLPEELIRKLVSEMGIDVTNDGESER